VHLFNVEAATYTEEQKKFASTLYFYSRKAYLYAREHLPLPHPSSIQRYMYCVNFFCMHFVNVLLTLNKIFKDSQSKRPPVGHTAYSRLRLIVGAVLTYGAAVFQHFIFSLYFMIVFFFLNYFILFPDEHIMSFCNTFTDELCHCPHGIAGNEFLSLCELFLAKLCGLL